MSTFEPTPSTTRWTPRTPKAIQLYSFPTPNGVKVSVMLEETGLPYDAFLVNFIEGEQHEEAFRAVNPNGKIPAILDLDGPGGKALALFESGAILLYLAEKSGQFLPADKKWEVTQWLMFQMAGIGPMFGQFGFFHRYGGKDVADPLPRERYRAESERLLGVLDRALEGKEWLVGEYSIADMAICPWLNGMLTFYEAGDLVGWKTLKNVPAYLERFLARPAVQRALNIPEMPKL